LITNIGYGHLEFFGSLEGVAKAKLELFRYLEKRGTIFYCSDDEILSNAEIPLAKKVVTFGIEKAAQIEGTILGCDNNARYTLKVQGEKIKLNISGRHNVYNALAAIAVGLEMNVPIEQIKRGLQKFSPVENRMEILNLQGVVVINDTYNSNPSSAKAALQTLADMQAGHNGRKIVVMGGMAELGDYARLEHERMGQLIAMLGFSELCTYGENTEYMNKAVVKSGKIETHHFSDHKSLSDYLLNTIHKGDIVLVKGSRAMAMEKVVDMLSASLNSKRMN
jgi:UDP-N-acetylmuramoyl-tripeptide--D-alanyl-D-alanine ligase